MTEDVQDLIERIRKKDGKTKEIRLNMEHKDNCGALKEVREGNWDSPWTFVDNETEFIGDEVVIILKCNDRECNARIAIETSQLLKSVKPVVNDNKMSEDLMP